MLSDTDTILYSHIDMQPDDHTMLFCTLCRAEQRDVNLCAGGGSKYYTSERVPGA